MKIKFLAPIIFFGTLINSSVFAEDVTISAEADAVESVDLTGKEGNQVGGYGGEIITQAFSAAKITFKMSWVPWSRAQLETMNNKAGDNFIIPLTRNSEREANYNWVAKIYDNPTAFIYKKGEQKIDTFALANGKKIGVLLGSSYEGSLKDVKNGIDKSTIESVPNDDTNAKKLEAGKISAWYTGTIGAFAIFKSLKIEGTKFESGAPVVLEENYIAASKKVPEELVKKVKDAIENFKKTADYQKIVDKYTKGK